MCLTPPKERREKEDLIMIYKLMNNLEETDKKIKGAASYLMGHK